MTLKLIKQSDSRMDDAMCDLSDFIDIQVKISNADHLRYAPYRELLLELIGKLEYIVDGTFGNDSK